jgi:hypothetical protein
MEIPLLSAASSSAVHPIYLVILFRRSAAKHFVFAPITHSFDRPYRFLDLAVLGRRGLQELVAARSWRFESSLGHQILRYNFRGLNRL